MLSIFTVCSQPSSPLGPDFRPSLYPCTVGMPCQRLPAGITSPFISSDMGPSLASSSMLVS